MTLPAARKGDNTLHGPTITGAGAPKVKIGNKNAWRVGDFHSCSLVNAPPPAGVGGPHTGGSVLKGSFTVLIGMQPAARQTDIIIEPAAIPPPMPPNNVIMGGAIAEKVLIGDIPFGLADPANLAAFCAEFAQLKADWPGLDDPPDQQKRKDRVKQLLDNALRRAGAPPLQGVTDAARAGANGSFSAANNVINFPSGFFNNASLAGKVGQTMLHEARHATQFFNTSRLLAGQGASAGQIAARGIHPSIANAGAANPVGLGTAAGQHGAMNFNQAFGSGMHGRAWDNATRQAVKDAYKNHGLNSPEYRQAVQNYFGLPNEADARATQLALAAGCPAAN